MKNQKTLMINLLIRKYKKARGGAGLFLVEHEFFLIKETKRYNNFFVVFSCVRFID